MNVLFTPFKIKNMEVRNRFIRSATGDSLADGAGLVTDRQVDLFSKLAAGGVGLIVSGITYVHPGGKLSTAQGAIDRDETISGLKRLSAAVHARGAKIAVQLFHAGRQAARYLNPLGEKGIGPSYIDGDPYFTGEYRAMSEEEIWEVIRAYGAAAGRARDAGFDAVQLHAAHAYLPSQFLSPSTNRRSDGWGGVLDNRLRFHLEICKEIRRRAGQDYPLLIKLGVCDGFTGGLELEEGTQAAQRLADGGYDSLEISQGLRGRNYEETEFRTRIDSPEREGYFRSWCRTVKRKVDVPVMMVGGLRTLELMEEVVQNGEADFVSLCRPLIREPGIIDEWKKGKIRQLACISCNKCLESLRTKDGLHCPMEKTNAEKASSPG